jgi:ribosomal protein S27AE
MMPNHQDPRWQRRRLEVMERDKWACVNCGAMDLALHVHHKHYVGELWEVPADELQTLCEPCHDALGPHPKGGIWYTGDGGFTYSHCPKCGGVEFKDKGSFEKCLGCSYRIVHPSWAS